MSNPYHFTTTASTNLLQVGNFAKFYGVIYNSGATAAYIKIYWMNAGGTPTVGTTIPMCTIGCNANTTASVNITEGLIGNGQLWVAVTGAAADTDTSSAPAGTVITVLAG